MVLQSMLAVPLKLPDGSILGVISFTNKQDTLEDTQQVVIVAIVVMVVMVVMVVVVS